MLTLGASLGISLMYEISFIAPFAPIILLLFVVHAFSLSFFFALDFTVWSLLTRYLMQISADEMTCYTPE